MAPIILTDHRGQVKFVIGASGGSKIITATALVIKKKHSFPAILLHNFCAQTLIRLLWFHDDVKQAVDGARYHHQLYPSHFEYEYGMTQSSIDELQRLGHRTRRYAERGSIVTALTRNLSGIFGVADFRKRGDVVGF